VAMVLDEFGGLIVDLVTGSSGGVGSVGHRSWAPIGGRRARPVGARNVPSVSIRSRPVDRIGACWC
jgi:hypothetical protein